MLDAKRILLGNGAYRALDMRNSASLSLIITSSFVVFLLIHHLLALLAPPLDMDHQGWVSFPLTGLVFAVGYAFGPLSLPVTWLAVGASEAIWSSGGGAGTQLVRDLSTFGLAGVILALIGSRGQEKSLGAPLLRLMLLGVLALVVSALWVFWFPFGGGYGSGSKPPLFATLLGQSSGFVLVAPMLVYAIEKWGRPADEGRPRPSLSPRRIAWAFAAAMSSLALIWIGTRGLSPIPAHVEFAGLAGLPIIFVALSQGYVGVLIGSGFLALALVLSAAYMSPDASGLVVQMSLMSIVVAALATGAATSDRATAISRMNATIRRQTFHLRARNEELTDLNAELEAAVSIDPLTGLLTRMAFGRAADIALAHGRTTHKHCALLFVDLDDFKQVNDDHGHACGDAVLRNIGLIVRRETRSEDLLCRYGGDELIILLCEVDVFEARMIAERLREAVSVDWVDIGRVSIGVTVSIGLAFQQPKDTLESLMQRADKGLYDAKSQGRNRLGMGSAS